MTRWVPGRIVTQRHWTDRLHSLCIEADLMPFEAGQFSKLALEVEGQMLARPYSFVNAPHERPHEFYFAVLPDGPLTARLARLAPGDAIHLAPFPAGFLVLSEVPDAQNLWLLATGTGIGPFLSILKTETPWRRFGEVVLVHAVRTGTELAYRDTIKRLAAEHPARMRTVQFVSRESCAGALPGRIPQAMEEGRLEAAAGVPLSAATSQVMLCGNPQMLKDAMQALARRGMKKHRRRDPGHITMENYW